MLALRPARLESWFYYQPCLLNGETEIEQEYQTVMIKYGLKEPPAEPTCAACGASDAKLPCSRCCSTLLVRDRGPTNSGECRSMPVFSSKPSVLNTACYCRRTPRATGRSQRMGSAKCADVH